jgi:hypothetical protein
LLFQRGPIEGTAPENLAHQSSSTPEAPILNAEDLNHILASAGKDNEGDENQADSSNVGASPGKRGRKRKRKAVASVKPNKKKKGPATRAQAAVKSAIKQTTVGNRRKIGSASSSKSAEGRVTRSMIGKNSLVANIGLNKIKLETDFVALKTEITEPEDAFDSFNVGTGLEHLEDSTIQTTEAQNNTESSSHIHFVMPSFTDETDGMCEEDVVTTDTPMDTEDHGNPQLDAESVEISESAESVEISESAENVEGSSQLQQGENHDIDNSVPVDEHLQAESPRDTNYDDSDFSFLPDLPRIECVYSASTEEGKKFIDNLYQKVNEESKPLESQESVQVRSGPTSSDCDNAEHWTVPNVEIDSAVISPVDEPSALSLPHSPSKESETDGRNTTMDLDSSSVLLPSSAFDLPPEIPSPAPATPLDKEEDDVEETGQTCEVIEYNDYYLVEDETEEDINKGVKGRIKLKPEFQKRLSGDEKSGDVAVPKETEKEETLAPVKRETSETNEQEETFPVKNELLGGFQNEENDGDFPMIKSVTSTGAVSEDTCTSPLNSETGALTLYEDPDDPTIAPTGVDNDTLHPRAMRFADIKMETGQRYFPSESDDYVSDRVRKINMEGMNRSSKNV